MVIDGIKFIEDENGDMVTTHTMIVDFEIKLQTYRRIEAELRESGLSFEDYLSKKFFEMWRAIDDA